MPNYCEELLYNIQNEEEIISKAQIQKAFIIDEISELKDKELFVENSISLLSNRIASNAEAANECNSKIADLEIEKANYKHIGKLYIKSLIKACVKLVYITLILLFIIKRVSHNLTFFNINLTPINIFYTFNLIFVIIAVKSTVEFIHKKIHLKSIENDLTFSNFNRLQYDTKMKTLNQEYFQYKKSLSEVKKSLEEKNKELLEVTKIISESEYLKIEYEQKKNLFEEFNKNSLPITDINIIDFIFSNKTLKNLFTYLAKFPVSSGTSSYSLNRLLTYNEMCLYRKLSKIASENNWILLSKVRLSDIISPGKVTTCQKYIQEFRTDKKKYYIRFINQKHIDFVLVNQNYYPVLCIELDDSAHYDHKNPNCTYEHLNSHITKDIILSYCKLSLIRIDNVNISDYNFTKLINYVLSNKGVYYHYSDDNIEKFDSTLNLYSQKSNSQANL